MLEQPQLAACARGCAAVDVPVSFIVAGCQWDCGQHGGQRMGMDWALYWSGVVSWGAFCADVLDGQKVCVTFHAFEA